MSDNVLDGDSIHYHGPQSHHFLDGDSIHHQGPQSHHVLDGDSLHHQGPQSHHAKRWKPWRDQLRKSPITNKMT